MLSSAEYMNMAVIDPNMDNAPIMSRAAASFWLLTVMDELNGQVTAWD